jgi:hypothetical protein
MNTRQLKFILAFPVLLYAGLTKNQVNAQSTGIVQFVVTNVKEPANMISLDSLMNLQPGVLTTRSDFFTRNFIMIVEDYSLYGELDLRTILFPINLGLDCHQNGHYNGEAIVPISARICERNDY